MTRSIAERPYRKTHAADSVSERFIAAFYVAFLNKFYFIYFLNGGWLAYLPPWKFGFYHRSIDVVFMMDQLVLV